MNWKVRFKNKTWLTAFIALIVSFVYQLLSMLNIAPAVTEDTVLQLVNIVLMLLSGIGVIIDPTTTGITDCAQVMALDEPQSKN